MKKKTEQPGGGGGKGSGGFYKRGNASNISMATVCIRLDGSPQLAMLLNDDSYIDSADKLIDDFVSIVEMDGHHLPTLVHLGRLCLEAGNASLSEYWLSRAVKRGKARGSGGGSSGLATFYGGATSRWLSDAWTLLERVMRLDAREEAGDECVVAAKEFAIFGASRGFECLVRMVRGEEW